MELVRKAKLTKIMNRVKNQDARIKIYKIIGALS
jgi:hypothetical protein